MSAADLRIAVITLVGGRSEHLRGQIAGLRASGRRPDVYVIVSLGDPDVRAVAEESGIEHLLAQAARGPGEDLPLAAARNLGARTAIATGAELLIFLDVDCIPATTLIDRYHDAARAERHRRALLCGPVAYLPPAGANGYDLARLHELARPHASRPAPADGVVVAAEDRRLFWSLSFALTTPTWERIGGFCPDYRGYGGEDTDFAELAAAAGVGMRWVGGATAFHQHHPVSTPPVEHVAAIIGNARVFHRRWGWWPMAGWLTQFADLGLTRFDRVDGWTLAEPRPVGRHPVPGP